MICPHCGHIIDEPRSREEQRYLHALLQRWARYTGERMEQVKMAAKVDYGAFVSLKNIERGAAPPTWPGKWVDLSHYWPSEPDRSFVFVKSEAAFTKREEADFITFVQRRMMDEQVPIEDLGGHHECTHTVSR